MPYVPLHVRHGAVARAETRTVQTMAGPLAGLVLHLIEAYCDERGCDCRRVFLQIYSTAVGEDDGRSLEMEATISFGWEPAAFYRKWAGFPLSEDDLLDLQGPALARLQQQSPRAEEVLAVVKSVLAADKDYVARLIRHYQLFRNGLDQPDRAPRDAHGRKLGRNDPCWCGSGKKLKRCHRDAVPPEHPSVDAPARQSPV